MLARRVLFSGLRMPARSRVPEGEDVLPLSDRTYAALARGASDASARGEDHRHRTPDADEKFQREMAGIALWFRNYSLEKPPSVSEMIDFANALQLLGTDHVTEEHRDVLLPFLAKTEKDRRHL